MRTSAKSGALKPLRLPHRPQRRASTSARRKDKSERLDEIVPASQTATIADRPRASSQTRPRSITAAAPRDALQLREIEGR